MTNWEKIRDDIYDYVDGLLPLDEKKRIDKQLQDDEHAREFFDEVKVLRSQLQNLRAVRASSDFDTVLRTRIRMERSLGRRNWLSGSLPMPAMITAGAMLLLAAVFLLSPQRDGILLEDNTVSKSVMPGYRVSQTLPENAIQGSLPIRYVPIEPMILPSRGMAIDRLTPPSSNSSKTDSTSDFPYEGRLMQVEF